MNIGQLDKFLRVVGTTATILGLLSLVCFVAGSYFNGQIYTYLAEQTSAETSVSITTVTISITSVSSVLSECTVHPCTITRVLSETVHVSESLSGYVSRALPAAQARAAWETKSFLDNLGTFLLIMSVALGIVRFWIVRKKKSRNDRIIPVTKLPEGLRLCAQNIRDFVADSGNQLSHGHGWHAIALAIFAYEELGKYAELLRIKESVGSSQDKVVVKDALFRSHKYKQTLAKPLIPQDSMILLPAYFDPKYFNPKYFQTTTVTPSDTLRLQCVFVDWIDDEWQYGTPHDTERLKKFLNAILEALNKLETKRSV